MDIKKILKGFDKQETSDILFNSSLTLEELALATSIFVERKPRTYFCDDFGCSLGKYHYMLNRVITKIQSYLKFKLFAK